MDNVQFTAFGSNTEPRIADYEDFLESRCLPRPRDRIKLELKELDIPFYDPYLIIKKYNRAYKISLINKRRGGEVTKSHNEDGRICRSR